MDKSIKNANKGLLRKLRGSWEDTPTRVSEVAGQSSGMWLEVCSPYNYSTHDTMVWDSFLVLYVCLPYNKKHKNQFYLSSTFGGKKHVKVKQIKIYYPSITSINHFHLSQS